MTINSRITLPPLALIDVLIRLKMLKDSLLLIAELAHYAVMQ